MRRCTLLCAGVLLIPVSLPAAVTDRVDFNRDIRPILSDTCYKCHGPDEGERQAELRLDQKEVAFAERNPGEFAVVPGDSARSLVFQRISAKGDERMPPPESGKKLTAKQIALIKKWIDQGAKWRGHWAFIPPERPKLPDVRRRDWPLNPIDFFVLARLEAGELAPASPAEWTALVRRVTFDLTGLPPTPEEVDRFLADDSPRAYARLVDRLLHSPRYGEHQARYWLDAARYGDTHGLHLDNKRSIWPYRDWVVRAFNDNMPFDQFTIEQLAGDLLPGATLEQRVATGFNRCNVTTSEGGSIAEEYRVRYAVDRVETTATVWMGLTAGCAVCHDHKFDPISQKEFYGLFAYFNSLTEKAMDGNALLPPPIVRVPTGQEAKVAALREQIAGVRRNISSELARIEYADPRPGGEVQTLPRREHVWIEDALPKGAKPAASGGGPRGWEFATQGKQPVFSGEKASRRTTKGLGQHFFTAASPGLRVGQGDKLFAYVYLDPNNPPREIMLQFNDGAWEHRAVWGENLINWGKANTVSRRLIGPLPKPGQWTRLEVAAEHVGLKPGAVINGWAFAQFDGTVYWDKAGIVTATPQDGSQFESLRTWEIVQRGAPSPSLPASVATALKVNRSRRSAAQSNVVREYFLENVHSGSRRIFVPLHQQIANLEKQIAAAQKLSPGTMVMQDMAQLRPAFVLVRGQYDRPDKKRPVRPGVPEILPPLAKDAPPNRLGLAKWLVREDHPLTARVIVNRIWQRYFGVGIVKTAEDFGSQGQWPSHPRLLDWLATELIASGWDVKHIHRLIVTSATYRQSSRLRPESREKDPDNRLLTRGPRFRLDGEMIRDQALAVSGLLVNKFGGPGVKPYQPGGLWKAVGYSGSNTVRFVKDNGEALYRRSMYTFWKRTAPPPTMLTFDAPSRESCSVRRARTNTPLQALLLMNDEQFVEAARHLAQRIMKEAGADEPARITLAFRLATARRPTRDELAVFLETYRDHLAEFRADKPAAVKLLEVGDSQRDESLDPAELAACTMVANLILNLSETVTKG